MNRERIKPEMATREIVELVDDIDGSTAEGTIRFALDGTDYEIDLSPANAEALKGQLAYYAEHGRKMTKTPPPRSRNGKAKDAKVDEGAREYRGRVRAWAKRTDWVSPRTGRPVGDVGVLPGELYAAYEAAQRQAAVSEGERERVSRRSTAAVTFREPAQ